MAPVRDHELIAETAPADPVTAVAPRIGAFARTRARLGGMLGALAFSFFASGFIQLVNVMTGVLLARGLGPAGRGSLTAIILWPTIIAAVGTLGVTEACTYYTARQRAPSGTLVGTALAIAAFQAVVLVAIGYPLVSLVLSHNHGSISVDLAHLFLLFIPMNLMTLYLMAIVNGMERYFVYHLLRMLVTGSIGIILLGLALSHELAIHAVVIGYLAAYALLAVAVVAYVRPLTDTRLRFDRSLCRELMTFGVKSHSSNVPYLLNERFDQLVISIFLTPVRLGLYVTAVTMTSLTSLVGLTVSMVALPRVARLSPGPERTARGRRFVAVTIALSTAVSLPLIVFTPQLIDLFFGPSFHASAPVCRILLVATVILSTNRAIEAILKAVGRPLDAGLAEFIALGATFAALGGLLPALGLIGAALASLIAYSVSLFWMSRRAARSLEISVRQLLVPRRSDAVRAFGLVRGWLQRA